MPPVLEARVYYALKCLVCLAESRSPRTAKELAQTTGIPPSETAKILYQLTWAGMISSRRGPTGGFWLRRSPAQIRIREVMAFFRPPKEIDAQASEDSILRIWREKGRTRNDDFEELSLAELVREGSRISVSSHGVDQHKKPAVHTRKLR